MMDDFSKSVQRLRKLSPALNKATEDAKGVVQMVEKFLNEDCNVGLPTYLMVESKGLKVAAEDFDAQEGLCIGYDKLNAIRYGIVIQRNTAVQDESGYPRLEKQVTPWVSASRCDKLKTLPYLPKLLEMIADEAERSIKSVADVKATIESLVKAFTEVAPTATLIGPARAVRREVGFETEVDLGELLR